MSIRLNFLFITMIYVFLRRLYYPKKNNILPVPFFLCGLSSNATSTVIAQTLKPKPTTRPLNKHRTKPIGVTAPKNVVNR